MKTTWYKDQNLSATFELTIKNGSYEINVYGNIPSGTNIRSLPKESNDYNSIETNVNEAIENFILRIDNAKI